MFCVGDKIVHPLHGAGTIESIVEERVGRETIPFFVLKLPVSGLTLKIPTENCDMIGIRPIMDEEKLDGILSAIPALKADMTANWNHRYRENMERIKSGDLLEVAGVIKALMVRDKQRGLSTGERKMLHNAKQILLSEIVLVKEIDYSEAEARVNAAMTAGENK